MPWMYGRPCNLWIFPLVRLTLFRAGYKNDEMINDMLNESGQEGKKTTVVRLRAYLFII